MTKERAISSKAPCPRRAAPHISGALQFSSGMISKDTMYLSYKSPKSKQDWKQPPIPITAAFPEKHGYMLSSPPLQGTVTSTVYLPPQIFHFSGQIWSERTSQLLTSHSRVVNLRGSYGPNSTCVVVFCTLSVEPGQMLQKGSHLPAEGIQHLLEPQEHSLAPLGNHSVTPVFPFSSETPMLWKPCD